jgi:large subunit ribosomal protein L7Ae
MAPAKKTAAKKGAKAAAPADPLFPSKAKNFRIGGDIRAKGRDLSRFVRWPKYVRVQRQKKVLLQRLKCPPAINQFNTTLDKNQAAELFKLLNKYKPEDKETKAARTEAMAAAKKNGEANPSKAPPAVLKFGLKHVTSLIEQKKASLVVIAHDVNPIELVIFLPALCRKMGIPFCIVKGKSRLGVLTGMKNSAVVALTAVNSEDNAKLASLSGSFKTQFNETVVRKWGGGVMGLKTQNKMAKMQAIHEIEEQKKLAAMGR